MTEYIDRNAARKSYRPNSGSMSASLRRAREPYRVKNAILGVALGAFAVGVWAYSISAVKQDVFDDVDAEVEALRNASLKLEEKKSAGSSSSSLTSAAAIPEGAKTLPSPRGVLLRVEHLIKLDPERKTLLWGAPPIDNIGKINRSS